MYKIEWNDWSGFVPICYPPGLGGEFFSYVMFNRHIPFDSKNFPFIKSGKFSFVKEVSPLQWRSDNTLFGWFMKTTHTNTKTDHDVLVKRLGIGDNFYDCFPEEQPTRFDKISHAIAAFVQQHGSEQLDVNNDVLYDFINSFDYKPLYFDDYKFSPVHPDYRWFNHKTYFKTRKSLDEIWHPMFAVWKNAKAIQLFCTPEKGWIFYLLVFNKMYDYYKSYVEAGEGWNSQFFANLEKNFIERIELKYSKNYCLPINRINGPNINIDAYDLYFNKNDYSKLIGSHLSEDINIPKQALDYYYNINNTILNHFNLDHKRDFVSGREVYDSFVKHGPYYFEGK